MIKDQFNSVWRNYSTVRVHGAGVGMLKSTPFLIDIDKEFDTFEPNPDKPEP